MKLLIFSIFSYISINICYCQPLIQCKNENGKAVEWYVMYKLPKFDEPSGVDYYYLDSKSAKWTKSKHTIDDPNSAVGRTLDFLYNQGLKSGSSFHGLYNDEWPNGKHVSFTRGHTKGVVAGDENKGIWLVHSVPKFPQRSNMSYSYPHSGHYYGQILFCISLANSQYNSIGLQLLRNYPYWYDVNAPSWLKKGYPNLYNSFGSKHNNTKPGYHIQVLIGTNKTKFVSFSKSKSFDQDLYSDLVAKTLKVNLLTETWQRGSGHLGPSCEKKFTVLNIKRIQFNEDDGFTSYDDHSKWAISDSHKDPWVCIGDINRMKTQFKRGGGTVCTKNIKLWYSFNSLVKDSDNCN